MREAVAGDKLTNELMDAMLISRAALWKQYCKLHGLVVKLVARNELCRRFMAIPGVGPVTALSFMTAIDDPSRFRRSRDVAAYFGLTSWRWQSGSSIDIQGRISKAGLMLAKRGGHHKAAVAVARKLAVIMHAMWSDGTVYIGDPAANETDVSARAAVKDRKLLGVHA